MNKITIIEKNCKRCGICAYVCPKKVFDMEKDEYPAVGRPDDCIGCKQCELKCPDFAIQVEVVK